MSTRTWSGAWRALLVTCLAALAVLAGAGAASAHASLISTDPPDGTVVPTSPRLVTFTFDEAVTLPPDSVQIFDAAGDPVPTDVVGRGAVLSASVPADLAHGTYVVAWRVISADSHPVAGSLTFSVGSPSLTVAPPKLATGGSDGPVRTALGVVGALDYLGLLLAGGLLAFGLWTARGLRLTPAVRRRLAGTTAGAAALAALASLMLVPLNGADDLGLGVAHVLGGRTLDLTLVGDEVVVAALQVGGLGLAGLLARRRFRSARLLATLAAAVAVVSPAWVGHSRATDPVWLVLSADVVHLVAGAVWLGGLVGLALVLGPLAGRPRAAATVLTRFSTQGATVLAALTVTGTLAAWRILGSWSALVETGYGRVLLVKVGVVGLVALLAGLNRWRLLPRVSSDGGHAARRTAVGLVRTAVRAEAGLIVVVLALTGFLVDLSPNLAPVTRPDAPSKVAVAPVGDDKVLATLTPGTVGPNTLTVQVQDPTGEPLEGYVAPGVSISTGGTGGIDLGQVRVHPVAAGTYAGRVVLPRTGTWAVSVSLRTSRFDNPVTEVDVQVR